MPEAVLRFSENSSFSDVRAIQKQIIDAYEHDFSKHAPANIVPRIRMVWNAIPSQLSKENRKFIYGMIREGSRAKEYESAIMWLTDCGQIHKICRVKKPAIPLKAYEESNIFKLFMVDIGLISAMSDLDARTLLAGNSIFSEFKGALTEQYVLQQIISNDDIVVHYWSAESSSAEIDFILQIKGIVVPVEVKAEENLQAKSLKVFREKFNPSISVRTSMSDFRDQDWLINLPLYAISLLSRVIPSSDSPPD
jgi:predicted AAA+ superfamily ATPase